MNAVVALESIIVRLCCRPAPSATKQGPCKSAFRMRLPQMQQALLHLVGLQVATPCENTGMSVGGIADWTL